MNDSGIERSICIDHHVYDELSDIRAKQRSRPQPFVNVTAKVTSEDYAALGWLSFGMVHHNSVTTDTGCQSCLAGLRVIHRLGLRESDLIPVTMQMHTVTYGGIRILGATVLRLASKDECRQCCRNQTDDIRHKLFRLKLFLSRD